MYTVLSESFGGATIPSPRRGLGTLQTAGLLSRSLDTSCWRGYARLLSSRRWWTAVDRHDHMMVSSSVQGVVIDSLAFSSKLFLGA